MIISGIIITVVLVALYWMFFLSNPSSLNTNQGSISNLVSYFQSLKNAKNPSAFLIISLQDERKFIQFKYVHDAFKENSKNYKEAFGIEFPVITEYQKSIAPLFRKSCEDIGLDVLETKTNSSDIFYDVYYNGSAKEMGNIVKQLFVKIFDSTEKTLLTFQHDGFEMPEHLTK